MKKLLKRFALALAILIALAGTLVWFGSMDIAPQDASDLTLLRPQPSPPSNGYTSFLEATRLLTERTNQCLTIGINKPVDTNGVLKVLESNEPAIALIEKATQCSHFRQPDATLTNVYNHISTRQFMAKLLAFKIKLLLLPSGRYEEAVQTAVTLLKFGNLHLQDTRCLLDFETSRGHLLWSGLSSIRYLATNESLTTNQLAQLSNALNSLASPQESFNYALKGELLFMSIAVDKAKDGTLLPEAMLSFNSSCVPNSKWFWIPAFYLHPNRTKKWIAEHCRMRIPNIAVPYVELTNHYCRARSEEPCFSRFRPNILGYAILETYKRGIDQGFKSKFKLESEIAATRLVVACHLYRMKEGKFPHTLQELVPTYLPEVPVDPYDGKAFRYAPEKKIVYAVGEDLIDSDGAGDVLNSSGYPIKRAKDLVYSLVP